MIQYARKMTGKLRPGSIAEKKLSAEWFAISVVAGEVYHGQ